MTTDSENYNSPLKSIYYLIAGVFIFSLQDVIIKWISGKYPVHEIVLIRSCISIIPILFIAYLEGGLHLLRTNQYLGHIIRTFFMFGSYICFYLSIVALPLAETVSLYFSAPIFIAIFSVTFLGEKVEFRSWIAVLVGFIGVIIMLRPSSKMIDPAAFLAVLTAVLYAMASIFTTPIAAVVFSLEVLMLDLTTSSIIPLLISSVTGAITTKLLMAENILVHFKVTEDFVVSDVPFFIILGILSGIVSLYFSRMHEFIRARMEPVRNIYLKVLIGGLSLGILIFIFEQKNNFISVHLDVLSVERSKSLPGF